MMWRWTAAASSNPSSNLELIAGKPTAPLGAAAAAGPLRAAAASVPPPPPRLMMTRALRRDAAAARPYGRGPVVEDHH